MWSVTIALLLGDCRWLRAASHWLLAAGCGLLATDCWLLAARYYSLTPLILCIPPLPLFPLRFRLIPAASSQQPVARSQMLLYTERSCTVHTLNRHEVLNRGARDRFEGAEVPEQSLLADRSDKRYAVKLTTDSA